MALVEQPETSMDTPLEYALAPWQYAIKTGNHAFQHGKFDSARDKYQSALNLAGHLLEQFVKSKPCDEQLTAIEHCCPALVVAAHNLADCFLALSNPERACKQLIEVHLVILNLVENASIEIVEIACHHLHKTRQELINFASCHPHLPELIEKVNTAMEGGFTRPHIVH
ncbi:MULTISPECIES: hypothetical protein [Pseudoalteromonas]|uniref:Tetratricopeptide repeat protein n=1 Tax=Pseudoalteromonas luteoviolacea (strain 2ta16) TaxID=1353533 RepID=V4I2Q8_PSEL2|nr:MULTISPECIES: hypothetical protein [Pseudoalteromonas]ESP94524.1 hypothetical protein PL2TA16_00524 [Pseudoalteromonas luteoviolacea 2ta16]KZN32219.1 hypothetical protein N483_03475 [Pseudoalteromonas luteoviolacea NCIMB 1944]MCG7548018.1 hypothetical protein [Pseudoalteromonas sp. Of7M-16]